MGSLFYGANRLAIEIDDTVLRALELVSITKIRRREPFLLHWQDDSKAGSGRGSVVISPHVELHFSYLGPEVPHVDRNLVEAMARASNSTGVRIDLATIAPRVASEASAGTAGS